MEIDSELRGRGLLEVTSSNGLCGLPFVGSDSRSTSTRRTKSAYEGRRHVRGKKLKLKPRKPHKDPDPVELQPSSEDDVTVGRVLRASSVISSVSAVVSGSATSARNVEDSTTSRRGDVQDASTAVAVFCRCTCSTVLCGTAK